MARAGPRKVARYGDRFKATAVKLSSLPGVLIQDVAAALDIHPFMLSLWRKQVRDGVIVAKSAKLDVHTVAELRRLRELERRYKLLKEEHELLKKAIRFASDRKRKSSRSLKQTGPNTRLRRCVGSTR
ncbi:MAG: transposase [Burkholderiales bacterium]